MSTGDLILYFARFTPTRRETERLKPNQFCLENVHNANEAFICEEYLTGQEINARAEDSTTVSSTLISISNLPPKTLNRLPSGEYPKECSAEDVVCFPKCCPMGEYLKTNTCVTGYGTEFNPVIVDVKNVSIGTDLLEWGELYNLVIGNPCKGEWLRHNYTEIDVWSTGELILKDDSTTNEINKIQPNHFCLEYSNNATEGIICIPSHSPEISKGFYTSGMMLSVMGLVFILIIYLMVDTLHDQQGKLFICHAGCLAVAYILLLAVQLAGNFGSQACTGVAYAIQFFLLSSFLWLHVMCMDTYWCILEATGSSPLPYPRAKKWKYDAIKKQWMTDLSAVEVDDEREEERKLRGKIMERKAFVVYSFFVWILALQPIIAVVSSSLSPTVPATYVYHIMEMHCAMNSEQTDILVLYFYPFIGIFILFNILIFICITMKSVRFNWNMSGPHQIPRQRARTVFLQFVLISTNWTVDLISWALGGNSVVWLILHTSYILQGLITTLIFVFDDQVKDRVVNKLWYGRVFVE